jgi:type IV secretory pathway VirB4 component
MYLDGLLADTPLTGGLEPMLGNLHLRTLTVLGFPNMSRPGSSTRSTMKDFGYRWVTRFIALDKTEAGKTLTKHPPAVVQQAQVDRSPAARGDV